MYTNEEMVALRGSKQINTVGSLVSEDFYAFSVGEGTVISEVWVDGENVIDQLTDNASVDFLTGEVFRVGRGKMFSGIKITSGTVIIYKV